MEYSDVTDELKKTADLFFMARSDVFSQVLSRMCEGLASGHKILVFGNGGSASQAQHFAAELINKFLKVRAPLPAIALTTDTSAITSIANDSSFEAVFRRQVEALGQKGDVALGLSTSGNSPNVIVAFRAAKERGITTVALTGKGGGKMTSVCDYLLDVPSESTPRIQEVHLLLLHLMAMEIEEKLC
ncbi:MAG: SIS domain-containing protein [Candidatus Aminicenantes bacterium]|jgi:D-sedoheptulose 7-phosphate isomerase